MERLPIHVIATFPYIQQAREAVREKGTRIEDLLESSMTAHLRARGKEKCLRALSSDVTQKGGKPPLNENSGEAECYAEIYSFIVSRMIIAVINDRFLSNRYAVMMSKQAADFLEGPMEMYLMDIAKGIGIEANEENGSVELHFTTFLKHTARQRSPQWKLLNQQIQRGIVQISRKRFTSVVQHAIADYLSDSIPAYNEKIRMTLSSEIAEVVRELDRVKKEFQMKNIGVVKRELFPPCMKEILRQIEHSENVPHMGRFAIVTFLHAIGMNAEEIFAAFGTVPDFSAEKTRYQIEHITGGISSTEYSVPECSTMKSYGICYHPDALCNQDWMKHPLTYYRTKLRNEGDAKKEKRAVSR